MNEMFQNKTARIQREQESVNKTAAASGQPNKTECSCVLFIGVIQLKLVCGLNLMLKHEYFFCLIH